MKKLLPLGYIKTTQKVDVVSLEHAEDIVDDRFASPLEEILVSETRCEVLKQMKNVRAQMVFILREYGFSEQELVYGMKLSRKTLANYRYHANKLRANIEK